MILWLASYPKSGNTLLICLLSSYFFTSNGNFEYITEMGRWWCFEDAYQDYAHSRPLHYDQESTMNHYVFKKNGGLSIRLLKIN